MEKNMVFSIGMGWKYGELWICLKTMYYHYYVYISNDILQYNYIYFYVYTMYYHSNIYIYSNYYVLALIYIYINESYTIQCRTPVR